MKTIKAPLFYYEVSSDNDIFILYVRRDDTPALMYLGDTEVPIDFSLHDHEDLNTLANQCFNQARQRGLELPSEFPFMLSRVRADKSRDCWNGYYGIDSKINPK